MVKLKELLKGKLSENELALVPSSFDIVGDKIIFAGFPKELAKKQKIVGQTLLEHFHTITSVFKKSKKHSGDFRIPKLTWIAGSKSKEVLYIEHGTRLKFDIEKVYFSPRLGNERKRIFLQVKPKESVLCLFSGCGVYPLVILKNTAAKEALGIEINPLAHTYAVENVALNKIPKEKIALINDDVRKVLPRIKKQFDRILMPLPKTSEQFLDIVLSKIMKNGIIHLYCFGSEEELKETIQRIIDECKKQKKKCSILSTTICGHFSPRVFRWCIDFKVN